MGGSTGTWETYYFPHLPSQGAPLGVWAAQVSDLGDCFLMSIPALFAHRCLAPSSQEENHW